MAIKTLSQFKSRLRTGGARPNLFEANIVFPDLVKKFWTKETQEDFQFLCKATSMPASSIGVVDVPFRGRILKVAGDRTFEPWTVTVINEENYAVRDAFENWANKINNLVTGTGEQSPQAYMGSGEIRQLSRAAGDRFAGDAGDQTTSTQAVTKVMKVHDIWPSEIGSIDLSYDSSDAVEEFSVTFQVEYITSGSVQDDLGSTPQKGNGGNDTVTANELRGGATAESVTGTAAGTAAQ